MSDRAIARAELDALCAVLLQAGPDAPTLCEGWDAHDLAIHLWQIRFDPLSIPGLALPAFAPTTARRASEVRGRWAFSELVRRLGDGSGWVWVMGSDWLHHVGEFYVHAEDVRRASDLPRRVPDSLTQDALWRRLRSAARALLRRGDSGLLLERSDTGSTIRVRPGASTTHVIGTPAELLLYAHRPDVADVRIVAG